MKEKKEALLEICDLSVSFCRYEKGWEKKDLPVISDLYLTVDPGEIVAIAGASGSGKSLLAAAILGILPENASVKGQIRYQGKELEGKYLEKLRGEEIALVPQSVSYLDPLMKIGKQVEGHRKPFLAEKRKRLFQRFGLEENTKDFYPFQLSGGMARRVLVSTALMTDAKLIIADEPTPGMSLDQALEALYCFREMAKEGKGVVLITHDIDLAFEFADKVAVFYAGTTVEIAPASDFKKGRDGLRHPYSKALWEALPQNGFRAIEGSQPYAGTIQEGCLFAPRCPYKTSECIKEAPRMRKIRGGEVRCYHGT